MHAPSETELVRFKGWTLRVRSTGARPIRLLLLIHGWTGDENSMWVFARKLPSNYWILAPRAPHATKPAGYSWRLPPPERDSGPDLEALRLSAEALISLVDAYSTDQGFQAGTFDVMGFSQGAALAGALTLLFPSRIGKAALLAGFIPKGAETLVSAHRLEGVRIFSAHGSMDEMVDIEMARRAVQLLEAAGAVVTVCEDEVGHRVSAGCLRGLQAFLLS